MMDNFTLDPTLYDGRPADCTGARRGRNRVL